MKDRQVPLLTKLSTILVDQNDTAFAGRVVKGKSPFKGENQAVTSKILFNACPKFMREFCESLIWTVDHHFGKTAQLKDSKVAWSLLLYAVLPLYHAAGKRWLIQDKTAKRTFNRYINNFNLGDQYEIKLILLAKIREKCGLFASNISIWIDSLTMLHPCTLLITEAAILAVYENIDAEPDPESLLPLEHTIKA